MTWAKILVSVHRENLAARRSALVLISESQNHRCAYCGVRMLLPRSVVAGEVRAPAGSPDWHVKKAMRFRQATMDHLIPRCLGGTDDPENAVAACLWCNEFRGNNTAVLAWARISRMVRRGSHPHNRYEQTGYWTNGIKYLPTVPQPVIRSVYAADGAHP